MEKNDFNRADEDFVRAMIVHHEAALKMAGKVIKSGVNIDIEQMALRIRRTQSDEIAKMRQWLADRDLSPSPAGEMDM